MGQCCHWKTWLPTYQPSVASTWFQAWLVQIHSKVQCITTSWRKRPHIHNSPHVLAVNQLWDDMTCCESWPVYLSHLWTMQFLGDTTKVHKSIVEMDILHSRGSWPKAINIINKLQAIHFPTFPEQSNGVKELACSGLLPLCLKTKYPPGNSTYSLWEKENRKIIFKSV